MESGEYPLFKGRRNTVLRMLCPTLFSVENKIMSGYRLCYIYFYAEFDGNSAEVV